MKKHVRELTRRLRREKIPVAAITNTKNGHLCIIMDTPERRKIFFSSTPGDYRAIRNLLTKARNILHK